jgi:ribosomal protein S12 methylthiotransferase
MPLPITTESRFFTLGNKVHFISLGCPRNLVDTEVMLGILLKAGYEVTESLRLADHIVINTCGFLQASRKESVETIEEAISQRKKGAKVIVTGCMVQKHSHELPQVDYLLGSGDVEGILKAVQSETCGSGVTSAKSYLEAGEVPRTLSTPKNYAYLKIAEGCKKKCAYCIIPDIKGPLKSKEIEQVKREFLALLSQGVKEIILIAQDLGDWGKDLGFKKTEGLLFLLKELIKEKGDFWIRLLYLYPDEITKDLVDVIKSDPRICRYLDMPIQHVNNRVLKAMRRATNREQIIQTLQMLKSEIPDIVIRTSLITGFPSETHEEFLEVKQFLKDYPLDNVGIFQYSQEPGSPAASMPDQISPEVKQSRWDELMKIQKKSVSKKLKSMIGKTLEVVVESAHPESPFLLLGRYQGQCPEIDGHIIITDGRLVNKLGERYQVKITDVADYDLVGVVTGSEQVCKSNKVPLKQKGIPLHKKG